MHDHSRFQRDINDVTGVSLSLPLGGSVRGCCVPPIKLFFISGTQHPVVDLVYKKKHYPLLPLTKVTDAHYRKRFRASYKYCMVSLF